MGTTSKWMNGKFYVMKGVRNKPIHAGGGKFVSTRIAERPQSEWKPKDFEWEYSGYNRKKDLKTGKYKYSGDAQYERTLRTRERLKKSRETSTRELRGALMPRDRTAEKKFYAEYGALKKKMEQLRQEYAKKNPPKKRYSANELISNLMEGTPMRHRN